MLRQRNHSDCGVFAIAAICNGQNPDELTFNITRMWRHLYNCLEEEQMRHFPAHPRKRRQTIRPSKFTAGAGCRKMET